MKRDYSTGTANDVTLFTGVEVEKTPAFGMETLFVVGLCATSVIDKHLENTDIKHIFFGANHSFDPERNQNSKYDFYKEWESMITYYLKKGLLCTLDIPLNACMEFHDSSFNEYDNFIPQIRIPLPYTKLWNYNTMVKIDDVDFNKTNPGVWCHSLHDLMDRDKFTDWNKYGLDKPIER